MTRAREVHRTLGARLRLVLAPGIAFGPGKAELLSRLDETGSIAAAGRAMGMSYKRAWQLVEAMNAAFREPLVESSRGGAEHGGARLTSAGREVLERYRAIEARTATVIAADLDALLAMLADARPTDISDRK